MAAPKGNKYAIGNRGGCPPHYATAAELAKEIDDYFIYIEGEGHEVRTPVGEPGEDDEQLYVSSWVWDRKPEDPTICGLALYLGFKSRQTLYNYSKNKEFLDVLERGRLRIEQSYEQDLRGTSTAGVVFALKQMGWNEVVHNRNENLNHNVNTNFNAEMTREEALAIADMLEKEIAGKGEQEPEEEIDEDDIL